MAYNHLSVPPVNSFVPQPTEKQLKQTLKNTKYVHPSGVAKQILGSLDELRELKPSIREYDPGTGRKVDLMQLSGKVPVKVADQQLEVPVRLWLPKSFPKERPVVQIYPGPNMAMKAVNYVDSDGKVTLPYLTDWKEGRSDLPTLVKMLRFKFSQVCPVHQIRVASFAFGVASRLNSNSPTSPKDDGTGTTQTRHSMSDILDNAQTPEPDISDREKEILSYKKAIDTLTQELNGMRLRIRELEQAKQESQVILEEARNINQLMLEQASQAGMVFGRESQYSSGISNGSTQLEDLVKQLELERTEKEKYQHLLEEETERFQKEVKEKEKIKSRLDAKVSDLTQTREKIAILEVDKEDCVQKLQRTLKELKHSKTEVRELASLKRTLKARLTSMEMQMREQSTGTPDSNSVVTELQEKVQCSEKELEELSCILKDLEGEKQELTAQLNQSMQAEEELIGEKQELREQLDTALHLCAATDSQGKSVTTSNAETQTDNPSYVDSHTQSAHVEVVEQSIQVDTLTDMCARYHQQLEERESEILSLREEIRTINTNFQAKSKDAVTKIRQLLDIKEQLTMKNDHLRKEIEKLKRSPEPPTEEYEVALSSALQNIRELQFNLLGSSSKTKSTSDQLKDALAEIEEMKLAHQNEKLAMRQRVSDVIAKVKEREAVHAEEMSDLKARFERAQKQLQEVSNVATKTSGGLAAPTSSLISFMEVEDIAQHKLNEGTWGATVEGIFRGVRVAVRCVTRESLARFPIQDIHNQIQTMAQTRHPKLALFLAAAMDAPTGMMILTEPYTCSLRQAYHSNLIKPDKLPVLLDVALALNFLHLEKRSITHNNLSSHSVLVEEGTGGQWRAKLSDIGQTTPLMMLSKLEEREPAYFPPELKANSTPSLNSASLDVYSYGVLMCEVANSKMPASTAEATEMIFRLKDGQLPQIACLIQCCMADDPGQRPAMGNMIKKINHLIANKIQVP